MNQFIQQGAPLMLAVFLSLIGVAAVLLSQGVTLIREPDPTRRRQAALGLLVTAVPPNVCRAAFSFDIWVVTTLFANDPKTLAFYNIENKLSAIQLLLLLHLILFILVSSWGPVRTR